MFVYHLINFFFWCSVFYFVCDHYHYQKWCYINQMLFSGHFLIFVLHSILLFYFFHFRKKTIRILRIGKQMQQNIHRFFIVALCEQWEEKEYAQKITGTNNERTTVARMTLVFQVSRWAKKYRKKTMSSFCCSVKSFNNIYMIQPVGWISFKRSW